MYEIVTLRDKIRVEPRNLGEDRQNALKERIRQDYLGKVIEDKMIIVGLVDIDSVEEGVIVPGDAAVYYDTIFKVLSYQPMLHETVRGQIVNISEIGATVNVGPVDGLVHISQAMDDFVDFSKNALIGRKTKTALKIGDSVVANITAISTKFMMKIGLTMRMPGLGKLGTKKKEEKTGKKEKK